VDGYKPFAVLRGEEPMRDAEDEVEATERGYLDKSYL
jgi:hypothetical protein